MANRSEVWQYIDKISESTAKCKFCKVELSCLGGNTSGLMRHVKAKHPGSIVSASQSPKQPKLAAFGVGPPRPVTESRAETITGLIGKLIADNMLPVSIVDSKAFTELMAYLEPNYKVPCRQTMTARLANSAKKLKAEMKERLEVEKPTVSLTTDVWTSMANDAYMSVTGSYITNQWEMRTPLFSTILMEDRHTADYISNLLKDAAADWNLTVSAVVHDGAANVKETGAMCGWTDVHCAAHKLHLVVTGSLGNDKPTNTATSKLIGAASTLVKHFSHSPMATNALMKRQYEMEKDKQSLKLIQHCKTRWNSAFEMMERLDTLRWPVSAVLHDTNVVKKDDAKRLDMSDEKWELMHELLPCLRPLQVGSCIFKLTYLCFNQFTVTVV
jgi:hypothetical protein